jgi:hypothetical protein
VLGVHTPAGFSSTASRRAAHGVDSDEDGNGELRDARMCQLLRPHDGVRDRTGEVALNEPGARAYSLTFG